MISFASLYLGLVLGTVPVELVAAPEVFRAELLLDGRPAAELRSPWKGRIDLGREPAPHELEAVAFDANGTEVGRARQWVNRPRAAAEASFFLQGGSSGEGRVATVVWRNLASDRPVAASVTFDGVPLEVTDLSRIVIPKHVPERVHFLRAELRFVGGVTAVADATFGGERNGETLREMTAVAVVLEGKAPLPPPEEMAGWFAGPAGLLTVAAVEEGPKDVVLVCDGSAQADFQARGAKGPVDAPVTADVAFRFLLPEPRARRNGSQVSYLYPMSGRFYGSEAKVREAAREAYGPPAEAVGVEHLADAVATAGLWATEKERRRAVVLVTGKRAPDPSKLRPEEAERFLQRLGVPLFVWGTAMGRKSGGAAWSRPVNISSPSSFRAAVAAVDAALDRQRIVWVEGSHLPSSVTLGPAAKGIRLAR